MTLQQTSCDVSSREQVREKDTWHSNRNEITFFTSVLQKDRFEQNRKLKLRGQIILLVTSHPACCFVSSIIFQKMGGLAVWSKELESHSQMNTVIPFTEYYSIYYSTPLELPAAP